MKEKLQLGSYIVAQVKGEEDKRSFVVKTVNEARVLQNLLGESAELQRHGGAAQPFFSITATPERVDSALEKLGQNYPSRAFLTCEKLDDLGEVLSVMADVSRGLQSPSSLLQ